MRKNEKNLWNLNAQGGLEFGLRTRLAENGYHADSVWEHPLAAFITMVLCATLDFVMFKQLFGSFLHENVLIQYFSIIGCIIGMDVAPIYLGITIRKHNQGYNVSWILASLFLGAFLIALLANVCLRIQVRDLALPPEASATAFSFSNTAATEETSNPNAMAYAIFASALPIVTSFVSFGVSYVSSNPLKKELHRCHCEQVEREAAISQLEALLMEYDMDADLTERLTREDDEQYNNTLGMTRELGVMHCNYVRQRIKEHLGDPAATNELSKDCREPLLTLFDRQKEGGDNPPAGRAG